MNYFKVHTQNDTQVLLVFYIIVVNWLVVFFTNYFEENFQLELTSSIVLEDFSL